MSLLLLFAGAAVGGGVGAIIGYWHGRKEAKVMVDHIKPWTTSTWVRNFMVR